MRLRACTVLLLVMMGGCQHLPDGVSIDVENQVVEVGPCRCALPLPKNAPAPAAEPAAPDDGAR